MSALERALLTEQLAALRSAFAPGLSVVNWNSLGIPDFAAGFRKARMPGTPTLRCSHRISNCQSTAAIAQDVPQDPVNVDACQK